MYETWIQNRQPGIVRNRGQYPSHSNTKEYVKAKSAEILGLMEPKRAADITNVMLQSVILPYGADDNS